MSETKVKIILPENNESKIEETEKKLRVAAYCRVSTNSEEQATSYEAQVSYYTNYILQNPKWEMAGIFADDGISATNTKKRDDFNALIDACVSGKVDMVLTKSISRFARNTVDSLYHIRLLKEKNIPIFFEKEQINTMEAAGELLITILSSLVQEESRNISENVKWSLRKKYERGGLNTSRLLGYQKGDDGKLHIVPEEAAVVRYIFMKYLEGKSSCAIAKDVTAQGKKTIRGNTVWNPCVIDKILQNEKYMGDMLSQKTYTSDFLTKKREKNVGALPQYYVENSHEPIVSREIFYMAREERIRRNSLRKLAAGNREKEGKSKHSGKYALTEILVCGECGRPYRRQIWAKYGDKKAVWRCSNRLTYGKTYCKNSPTLDEERLHESILEALNRIIRDKDAFMDTFRENVMTVLQTDLEYREECNDDMKELQKQIRELIQNNKITDEQEEYEMISRRIDEIRRERIERIKKRGTEESQKLKMEKIYGFLERKHELKEYDDNLVRSLIKTICVINEQKMEIHFKSGTVMTQRIIEKEY